MTHSAGRKKSSIEIGENHAHVLRTSHYKSKELKLSKPLFSSPALHLVLIILSLLIVFFLTYAPHFQTQVPLHIDEWHHISQSYDLLDFDYSISLSSLRVGFHMFLAVLTLIVSLFGYSLVDIYFVLPAIWSVFSGITLYILLSETRLSLYAKVISVVCFGTLFSNINVLGLQTFVASTFVIPFIFLFLVFYFQSKFWPALFFGLLILGCYPVALLFFYPLLFAIPNLRKLTYGLGFVLIASILCTVIFFSWKYNLNGWTLFVFSDIWLSYERFYLPFELVSAAGFVLFSVGLFVCLYSVFRYVRQNKLDIVHKTHTVSRKRLPETVQGDNVFTSEFIFQRLCIVWFCLGSFYILIQYFFSATLLVPYVRALYYGIIIFPIIAAYGFSFIEQFLPKLKILFCILCIPILVLTYPQPSDDVIFLPIHLDQFALDSYTWLNTQEEGKIFAERNYLLPLSIYTHHKPIIIPYFSNVTLMAELHGLQYTYCDLREEFLIKHRASYVRLHKDRPCPGWVELYRTSGNFIYDVRHITMPKRYDLVNGTVVAR
jgi:hypothetical protein